MTQICSNVTLHSDKSVAPSHGHYSHRCCRYTSPNISQSAHTQYRTDSCWFFVSIQNNDDVWKPGVSSVDEWGQILKRQHAKCCCITATFASSPSDVKANIGYIMLFCSDAPLLSSDKVVIKYIMRDEVSPTLKLLHW